MEHLMGRYRNVSILAAAIFLQIVGLAVQVKRRSENRSTRLVRVWTVAAVTPLEKNIVRVQSAVSDLWHNYVFLRGVRQQNRELQNQIQQLQLEQVRLRQDAEQARRLQALLGFKEQFIDKTTAAQVIGSSGSEQSRIVYLDKGTADGITPDMAVISAQGIVGKVIQVFRHTSQVLLVNDQTSGVGTILERSRLQGVLKGRASGELVLDKIMAEEDVQAGDRVLTSGGDQIFPKGLPVGLVANVRRGAEFLQVTVRPAASLTHLEEVLVITKKQEREPAVASSAPMRAADILAQRLPSVPDKPVPPANQAIAASGNGTAPQVTPQASSASRSNTIAHVPTAAPSVQGSTAVPSTVERKTQPPSLPHTQAVDFVRGNPASGGSVPATAVPGQSKSPTSQVQKQTTSAGPERTAEHPNALPPSAKPADTNTTNRAAPTGSANTVKPKAAAAADSTAQTSAMAPTASPTKTPAATTQAPKPLKPTTSAPKPAANAAQPATQPETEDTPQ